MLIGFDPRTLSPTSIEHRSYKRYISRFFGSLCFPFTESGPKHFHDNDDNQVFIRKERETMDKGIFVFIGGGK